jgi:hypothetical protein
MPAIGGSVHRRPGDPATDHAVLLLGTCRRASQFG